MPDLEAIGVKLAAVERALATVQVEAAKGQTSEQSRKAFVDSVACLCEQADGTNDADAGVKLADDILRKVNATTARIDVLVSEGRKFNASRARQDLYAVTANLNDVLLENNLSDAGERLAEIDQEASRIHGLFFPSEK